MKKEKAMTIGGSDSSGGAGIQADLKAFTALNVHGSTILTSITVQNTQGVKKIIPISADDIEFQIETVMQDSAIKYVKTGLLYQPQIAHIVANATKKYNWNLVIDPVLTATSGDSLASADLTEAMKKKLIPNSTCITPNIPEAEALTQTQVKSFTDMEQAAKKIHSMGAKYVIVKGGHLPSDTAYDILYDGKKSTRISLPRIPHKKAHGSGCTFSALLTGYLAKGDSIQTAFSNAKYVLWTMIHNGYHIGKGSDVLDISTHSLHDAPNNLPTQNHIEVWIQLHQTVKKIINILPLSFTPEVGCNIGYALPCAKNKKEICAINGRIIRSSSGVKRCGTLRFGASDHISSIILAAMKEYSDIRSVMNIKYNSENLSCCKKTSFLTSSFDRANEPKSVHSTMEWGTRNALQKTDHCPDFIYDNGGIGKEPMIRILGRNPEEIFEKISILISHKKKS